MKKNNKGFSLVELIIVIAIMAILAGAIAPALIRYIDKSRKSNDVTAAKTIKTAVETAMSNEKTYEMLTTGTAQANVTDKDNNVIKPYGSIVIDEDKTTGGNGTGVTITASMANPVAADKTAAQTEIGKNIGEKTPRIKFRKSADEANTVIPHHWQVYCTQGGSVIVGLAGQSSGFYQLAPQVSAYYQ